jgi:hypothetical protein
MLKVIEVDHTGHLTFSKLKLQFSHGCSIVFGIVERKVADLIKSKSKRAKRYNMKDIP